MLKSSIVVISIILMTNFMSVYSGKLVFIVLPSVSYSETIFCKNIVYSIYLYYNTHRPNLPNELYFLVLFLLPTLWFVRLLLYYSFGEVSLQQVSKQNYISKFDAIFNPIFYILLLQSNQALYCLFSFTQSQIFSHG
jgi:hypothetical protein